MNTSRLKWNKKSFSRSNPFLSLFDKFTTKDLLTPWTTSFCFLTNSSQPSSLTQCKLYTSNYCNFYQQQKSTISNHLICIDTHLQLLHNSEARMNKSQQWHNYRNLQRKKKLFITLLPGWCCTAPLQSTIQHKYSLILLRYYYYYYLK